MTILASFIGGLALFLLAQLAAAIMWAIRHDKTDAVALNRLDQIHAMLTSVNVSTMRVEITALQHDSHEHYAGHERNRKRIDEMHDRISIAIGVSSMRHDSPAGGISR